MKVMISANRERAEADLDAVTGVVADARDQDLRFLTQASGLAEFPTSEKSTGCVYYQHPAQFLDEAFVGASIRLFRNSWGRAFLRHACRMVRPGGRVTVAYFPDKQAAANGMWSLSDFEDFFGAAPLAQGKQVAVFAVPERREVIASTLDWYTSNAATIVLYDMLHRANPEVAHYQRQDHVSLEFLHDSAEKIVGASRRRIAAAAASAASAAAEGEQEPNPEVGEVPWYDAATSIALESELSRALRMQAYYVGGVSYKSAVISHIIRTLLPGRQGLDMIDFGGGYGLLMAELLLDAETPVERGVVRDTSVGNLAFATVMYRQLRVMLRDRFFFSLGSSQEFRFDDSYDVVSFVGSLLYVPKDDLADVVRRCWDAIRPGGLFIVHENIKHPKFVADFDVMFTVEEIDRLLGGCGEIRRYMSTTIKELDAKATGERTVFRVVQKPV